MLEESIELMQPAANAKGVNLRRQSDGEVPTVAADHDRIQQVLVNLLDNAIKYTPAGGTVTGAVRAAVNGIAGVELVITDTGEGIPEAHIPRLTERFYRVDRARSRELGGTGLGLAIVKHIVQLHNGHLTIQSRVREGTIVTVWLPSSESEPSIGAAG